MKISTFKSFLSRMCFLCSIFLCVHAAYGIQPVDPDYFANPPSKGISFDSEHIEKNSNPRTVGEEIISFFARQKDRLRDYLISRSIRSSQQGLYDFPASDSCAILVLETGDVLQVEVIRVSEESVSVYRCNEDKKVEYFYQTKDILSLVSPDGSYVVDNRSSKSRKADSRPTNTLAVIAFVFSILGVLLVILPGIGIALGVLSNIGAIISLIVMKAKGEKGQGYAIAAIIFGLIAMIAGISFINAIS